MKVTTNTITDSTTAAHWVEDWQQQQIEISENARLWGEIARPVYERLARLVAAGAQEITPEYAAALTSELNALRAGLRPCPQGVSLPYWHLDNALDDALSSLRVTLEANAAAAKAYLRAAQIELGFFELELFRLGVTLT